MSGITTAWSERLDEYVKAVEEDYVSRTDSRRWELSNAFTKEYLVKDYPVLLSSVRCGVSIQPGWAALVHSLCSDITMVMAANPTLNVRVEQVKQKLGWLRFYGSVYTHAVVQDELVTQITVAPEHIAAKNKINQLISAAQTQSASICEVCGRPGQIVNVSGWLAAACERHGQP